MSAEERLAALEAALAQQVQVSVSLQASAAQASGLAAAVHAAQGAGVGGGGGSTAGAIESKVVGKPERFDGASEKWRDWSVVFKAYATAVFPLLAPLFAAVELADNDVANVAATDDQQRTLSLQLHHMIVMTCSGSALTRVLNCGQGEGLAGWRALQRFYEPSSKPQKVALLIGLLEFDFNGGPTAKVENFRARLAALPGAHWEGSGRGRDSGGGHQAAAEGAVEGPPRPEHGQVRLLGEGQGGDRAGPSRVAHHVGRHRADGRRRSLSADRRPHQPAGRSEGQGRQERQEREGQGQGHEGRRAQNPVPLCAGKLATGSATAGTAPRRRRAARARARAPDSLRAAGSKAATREQRRGPVRRAIAGRAGSQDTAPPAVRAST